MNEIIVGLDESEGAAEALRWAVREGDLRGRPVRAVLVWDYLDQHRLDGPNAFDPTYDESLAEKVLAEAVTHAVGPAPAEAIARTTVCDRAANGLIDQAADAELLVVGARGLGGFKSLLLGSVSNQCLHHAPCPVAVVHTPVVPASGPERIVVGIDGSATAQSALRWALAEARARRARLDVVHAWPVPVVGGPFTIMAFDPVVSERTAHGIVDDAVAAEDAAGVDLHRVVICGSAAPALLSTADGASLVVVGSRGRGGFQRLLLGSVSQQVAQHVRCPVVVVPPSIRRPGGVGQQLEGDG